MRKDSENLHKVYVENNMHYVLLPDGTKIPNIISTIVEDGMVESFVTIKVSCFIYPTKEDALSFIENRR